MKKIDKQDIFCTIWYLVLLLLEITLLVMIILTQEQLIRKIIGIVLTSISILLTVIGEIYFIYSLTSSIIYNHQLAKLNKEIKNSKIDSK